MCTAYRAYDPVFEHEVALKVMPAHLLYMPLFRERFQREARVLAQLDHPAIIPVYDYGEDHDQAYLVMCYIA